ncbi:MAG TPA: hypothetical protein VMQ46_04285 [Acidimicrobiia bacterium]|nr:hypothetical protein [Acidimicrobiia bacterium]
MNIGLDGKLDLDDLTMSKLDFTVAGVHSNFHLARKEQTARLIEGLRQPSVRVLAHPTGRRIGIRPPVDVDMEDVVAEAITSGVALECNGPPRPSRPAGGLGGARRGTEDGVRRQLGCTPHRGAQKHRERGGDASAGGGDARQVINTFDLGELTEWLGESSGRSMA